MHVMVKSMNFGGGGGSAESLHYYVLKQNKNVVVEKCLPPATSYC